MFMYGDVKKQVQIVQKFITLMRERVQLLEPQEDEEDTQKI